LRLLRLQCNLFRLAL